ncbi:DUF6515 family protein [Mucilaginibacter sp. X5P1]|uniref:DUF6515 family protein n=1 Tax=Mucilaginibacter sp. X5P1 TaxID=2723088 RepID=UPI0016196875|nr:DUF6515 family protein [Mucilaginibacter sp. X5P1]MBB6139213.1 hypothetical protein [Mucilaginibacter sp. X5P1]
MKRLYKYASGLFLTGLLSVAVISTASAQHGGGGGGFHGGGGGGGIHSYSGGGSSGVHAYSGVRGNNAAVVAHRAYGGGYGYNRGGYYRSGYGYYGYPHLGFYLGVLPFGYYPFYWGSDLYYYYGGVFYSPYDGGGYQVTTPPIGAAVPSLPDGAKSIMIDGQQFYELNGVYFKTVVNDQGKKVFVVAGRDGVLNTNDSNVSPDQTAAPQVGDIVNELPDNCRKVSLNGKKYYVSPNGIYYQPYVDGNGNTGYRIASVPDNNDSDNDQEN